MNDISSKLTASLLLNTTIYFKDRESAVVFADDISQTFQDGSPWTMTIRREKSGVFSVTTVTIDSLEDTETQL